MAVGIRHTWNNWKSSCNFTFDHFVAAPPFPQRKMKSGKGHKECGQAVAERNSPKSWGKPQERQGCRGTQFLEMLGGQELMSAAPLSFSGHGLHTTRATIARPARTPPSQNRDTRYPGLTLPQEPGKNDWPLGKVSAAPAWSYRGSEYLGWK